jgi:hypothetical protein
MSTGDKKRKLVCTFDYADFGPPAWFKTCTVADVSKAITVEIRKEMIAEELKKVNLFDSKNPFDIQTIKKLRKIIGENHEKK